MAETYEEKIERQKALELDCIALGKTRYRADRPTPWQEAAHQDPSKPQQAGMTPGKMLLNNHVQAVADALTQFIDDSTAGKAGRKTIAVRYLIHIDPLQAAYISLRFAVNAGSGLIYSTLARQIGDAIKEHLDMEKMAADHPGLYRKLSRQLARSTSSKHRLGVLRHVREKYALERLPWTTKECIIVGSKMLELLLTATPLFLKEIRPRGRNDRPLYFGFNPETVDWLEAAHGRCELLSPIHLPMIVKPRPWRTPFSGGYLTDALHPKLIRTRNRDYLSEMGGVDLSVTMAAVNAIQETPWRISRKVLDVLLEEMALGGGEVGLPRKEPWPLPPLPITVPKGIPSHKLTASQREDLTAWKAQAARVHMQNGAAQRDRVILAQKLYIAGRFVDEEAIYFPHYLDFRGRVYPMAAYLTPQSDDIGRGLLEFAEGKPLGEGGAFWLAAHIAGVWGVDKVTFEERVAWVQEHEEEIMASALDPHENRFWTTADDGRKPWQGLAACFDWLGYKLNGDEHVSHLPIALDGTCSGLQHYSALLRDEVGGAAVNLVPSERPSDIYTMVAKRAQALSDSRLGGTNHLMAKTWEGKFCRKVAKQPTMTLCYSATRYGMKDQIHDALEKLDENGPYLAAEVNRHDAALYAAELVLDALGDTVVAARRAMAWLKKVSKIVTEADIPIRWTSPIGLPVLQDYRKSICTRLIVYVGGQRMDFRVRSEVGTMRNQRKQASSIAPNFVHSLDAAHLLATVNGAKSVGLRHFAVIHDSFAVHAADTERLNTVLRWAFVQQYTEPVLERFRDEIVAQLEVAKPKLVKKVPKLPAAGNLDLAGVMESDFFFA